MTGSPSGSPTGSPAVAAPPGAPLAVLVLQTAASLENLAVRSYTTAAGLPCVARGSARLRALVARNLAHHLAHAQAFNQAVVKAGGAPQHAADARYAATVSRRLAGLTDPDSLVSLLTELEGINAQTCTRYASLAEGGSLRSLFVNVASVEAQHGSELLILRTLPDGGDTAAHTTGATARAVPAAAGTAGIPHAAFPTGNASAINEGAVR
ncbi:ferritin-like domain-containing protein [Streptomyces sp. NBC_01485]|uniref:ferritin-like domain-containing protein n=1 Tax=Streptomyces sp. NBC_01485 TaxID=2903884 RepID=UPI002E2F492B|nr:ferritin-like domain-containing protein [Streptomyces sp. NBC_01485]